jgi:hydrogenase 3 maturation protease
MPPTPRPLRPPSLRRRLQKRLEGAQRVALLAIGSELRGDDAAGLLVADYLEQLLVSHQPSSINHHPSSPHPPSTIHHPPFLFILRGHTAPENCTGEIKKIAPTHLVIVDAANLGQKPGAIQLLEPEQIGGVSFSTHQMPLSVMLDYLKTSFVFETIVLTIQPAHLEMNRPMTPAVSRAARRLAAVLAAMLW